MRTLGLILAGAISLMAANSVHEFNMRTIDGKDAALSAYKGKVLLFVNVASQCGYTPQYAGLESLYKQYKDKGLVVLGFPANDFGAQEPGSDAEIKTFCERKYSVTFPMYSKISVKGNGKAPLYQYLSQSAGDVSWNFGKYLVGKDGKVIKRYDSGVGPESAELTKAIDAALAK
jgi:glutathione peroxidase